MNGRMRARVVRRLRDVAAKLDGMPGAPYGALQVDGDHRAEWASVCPICHAQQAVVDAFDFGATRPLDDVSLALLFVAEAVESGDLP